MIKQNCINCPVCGKLLCKADFGSGVEVKCHNCKKIVYTRVSTEGELKVKVIESENKAS